MVVSDLLIVIDSYQRVWIKIVKNLGSDVFVIMKKKLPEKWQYMNKKLAYPYQYFSSIDDFKKPVDNLNKEDFFSKLKNKCPDDEEIERTKEFINLFFIKDEEEIAKLCCKSDVFLSADLFEKFVKYLPKNMVLILFIV